MESSSSNSALSGEPPNLNTDIFATVVKGGFCIGCGVCTAFDSRIQMKLNEYGLYVATLNDESAVAEPIASRVCPFADNVPDENELGREIFGVEKNFDSHLGYYVANYAGWVVEENFREKGSSGGLVSWLLVELLDKGLVDFVVHVSPRQVNDNGDPLFGFTISTTSDEARSNAKSRYYPVEMSGVVAEILKHPGRYAVVGIPCFVKALRLASRESSILKERLTFAIGIVCGHLKSTSFAELFAWQCGITPNELCGIDFRTKLLGRSASNYAVTATGEREGQIITVMKPMSELFGSNWGHGFFKYKACDFCDDVVGETADISIGDAWLPQYESDSGGTNVVVVRSSILNSIISDAAMIGRLHLENLSAEKVIASQAGGFRHRRDGLAFRLYFNDQIGNWRPSKRVKPSYSHLDIKQRNLFILRYKLGQISHSAFAAAKANFDLNLFKAAVSPLTKQYDKLYDRSFFVRTLRKIKRTLLIAFYGEN